MKAEGFDEKKALRQARAVVDGFAACLDELAFDPGDVQRYALAALYCSFLDFTYGIVALLQNRSYWIAPIVLRAYAEALADFVNLSRDRAYLGYIEHSYYSQALRFCTGVESISKLASFANSAGFASYRDELREKLRDISIQGAAHMRVKDRFRMAGMEDFYGSIYSKLCAHAHSNIDALEARHLARQDSGKHRLAVRNDMPRQEKATYLYTALVMLHDATLTMREVLGLPAGGRLAPAMDRYRDLHRRLKPLLLD